MVKKSYHSKTITMLDGKLVPPSRAVISVFDNSLLYAEGLFETCLAVDERVVFLSEHLKRLYRGATLTDMTMPVNRKTLRDWFGRIAAKHPARIKKIRLTLTAGEAARWAGKQGRPRLILSAAEHIIPTHPYSLHVSEYPIDEGSVFRRIKTISYALHAAALKKAEKMGCDDALLLNRNNQIAEVTSANIFWLKGGSVFTPALEDGCLEGVTRGRVLAEVKKLELTVIEKTDSLPGLLAADEVFVSSSLKLIAPVSMIVYGQKKQTFEVGEITRQLRKQFFRLVRLPAE